MAEAELYVVVSVAGEHLGLRASAVLKVIEVGAIAHMPRLPAAVLGVTPYRGRIVTVVDMAVLLERARSAPETGASSRVVILDSGTRNVGLLVAGVEVIGSMDRIEPRRSSSEDDLVASLATCGSWTVGLIDTSRLAKRIAGLCDPART